MQICPDHAEVSAQLLDMHSNLPSRGEETFKVCPLNSDPISLSSFAPKCVWVQSQPFPFELARIGQRSSEVQGSAAVASEKLLVLVIQLLV